MALSKYLGERDFVRGMFRLAVPIALQNLLATSFSVVDTLMVGKLGEASLAAVGFAMTWGMFLNFLVFGASSGASVFISQFWGVKDIASIRKTYGVALIFATGIGLVFGLASFMFPGAVLRLFTTDIDVIIAGTPYIKIIAPAYVITAAGLVVSATLRSTELVKLPLVASLVSVAVNVALSYTLISGMYGAPALGVAGAAVASLVSAVVNLGILLGASIFSKNIAASPLRTIFSFDMAFVKRFLLVSLPIFLNEVFWGVGKMVFAAIYGRMGTDAYAALTAYNTIDSVMFTFFIGLCSATTIIVGKRVGAGESEEAYAEARQSALWAPIAAIVVSIALVAFREPFMRFFSLEGSALSIGVSLLIIASVEQPFRYFNFIFLVGIFRAGGDTRTTLKIDIFGQWAIGIALAALGGLVLKLPFLVVYAAAAGGESLIKVVMSIRRFVSKKWIMSITG